MDNKQHKEAVKNAIQPAFKGHTEVTAKYTPLYPVTAEREMRRAANGYVRIVNREVKKHLPEIMALYRQKRYDDANFDDGLELKQGLSVIFQTIAQAVEKAVTAYDLNSRIASIASIVKNTSLREWKRMVKQTLGVDLMSDYYSGSFYEAIIQQWIAQNVSKIKTISANELTNLEGILSDGFLHGKPIREIAKSIQKECNTTRSSAMFIARDQVGTLNSQITKHQQQDAGVDEYKWDTSHDERVRPCHQALNGKKFRWDDPPEMWTMTKNGIAMLGRRCNPGEDYACRCCGLPVFNLNTIDLPIQSEEKGKEPNYGIPEVSVSIGSSGM